MNEEKRGAPRAPVLAAVVLLVVLFAACVGTGGDPAAVVRADLARERIVVEQRDAFVALVDRVEGWTPEQRRELREGLDAQVRRYQELAEAERAYLEATGAPDWRDVAREVVPVLEVIERRGERDD